MNMLKETNWTYDSEQETSKRLSNFGELGEEPNRTCSNRKYKI